MSLPRLHGGPDAQGTPRWDFSTNANACGPCPAALDAVRAADPTHYPDPAYTTLRVALADFHGVVPGRVLLAASASECIYRLTAWVARQGGTCVHWPAHAYGDYAQAARAWGLQAANSPFEADLAWVCEPSSPLGQAMGDAAWLARSGPSCRRVDWGQRPRVAVLDCAYAPLRLSGWPTLDAARLAQVWQLWTPNKALGLTGLRGAYAIAPLGAEADVAELERLGPSWPLGAHAVAMLGAWTRPVVQTWLANSLDTLRAWKVQQQQQLQALGWCCMPSDTNFFCAHPPEPLDASRLRAHGVKLRDATSFGLPGVWRISVQPPAARQALLQALAPQAETHSLKEPA